MALIVYLAHIGSFVPAERARIGLTDRIMTRIARYLLFLQILCCCVQFITLSCHKIRIFQHGDGVGASVGLCPGPAASVEDAHRAHASYLVSD